jgi:aminoglycoside phosphotransferase (APT) family kinase protein
VHGDLHLRNIVVDQNHRLRGIIDWGDLHIGSPAVDLSIVYSFLPPDSRKHFYKKYGEVQKTVRELARFIGVYILILLILYGADNEDQPLLEVCRKGLDWALTDS